ncbi:MAG TPA: radical SAM protein [Bdellovibrionota bacterium]|nr:radical SAM protein [Bdellovibrionota bacterium]
MPTELTINEIYSSIQGESTWAGLPCVFVRLTGCDLRCTYCDTEYAFYQGKSMSLEEILRTVNKCGTPLVEITGGEPLLQKNVHVLLKQLADEGKTVLLETSGAHDISRCDPRVIRIVDIKCPSSRMARHNRWENIEHLRSKDEVKFVIGNREDFDWSVEVVQRYELTRRCPVLFSAVSEVLPLVTLAEWVRSCGLAVRLQPQLHKILWGTSVSI